MVIYHAGGLHVGIANGGAEKFEAALFHVLANSIGYWGTGGENTVCVINWLAIGHKAVEVFIKRTELLLHIDKQLGVADGRIYFQAIADDAFIV